MRLEIGVKTDATIFITCARTNVKITAVTHDIAVKDELKKIATSVGIAAANNRINFSWRDEIVGEVELVAG
jgi:hypothetical protein